MAKQVAFMDRDVSMTNVIISTSTGVLVGGTAGFFIGRWYEKRQAEMAAKAPSKAPVAPAAMTADQISKEICSVLSLEEAKDFGIAMASAKSAMGDELFGSYSSKLGGHMVALVEKKRIEGHDASSKLFNDSVKAEIGKLKGEYVSKDGVKDSDALKKHLKTINQTLEHYATRAAKKAA